MFQALDEISVFGALTFFSPQCLIHCWLAAFTYEEVVEDLVLGRCKEL